MLEDASIYEKLDADPTASTQKTSNALLLKIFKSFPDHQRTYRQLRCWNGSIPRLYGLPKLHKEGILLRPIVDFPTSPLYGLAKYLHFILQPLTGQRSSHVSDSKHFVQKLKPLVLAEEEAMVSLDVISLYTNTPVELALQVAKDHLARDNTLNDRTPLTVSHICELLQLCLNSTVFVFNGVIYKQKFEVAMGASVSVTIANLVMEDIERRAELSIVHAPRLFLRYVDDCFVICKRDQVEDFCNFLSNIEPSINFTIEWEKDSMLPFLDVLVKRLPSGILEFEVYRKKTHCGRYLHFSSANPLNHKISVVSSLANRARIICSSREAYKKEISFMTRQLKNSGYSEGFSRRIIRRKKVAKKDTGNLKRIPFPFISGCSSQIRRICKNYNISVLE